MMGKSAITCAHLDLVLLLYLLLTCYRTCVLLTVCIIYHIPGFQDAYSTNNFCKNSILHDSKVSGNYVAKWKLVLSCWGW